MDSRSNLYSFLKITIISAVKSLLIYTLNEQTKLSFFSNFQYLFAIKHYSFLMLSSTQTILGIKCHDLHHVLNVD